MPAASASFTRGFQARQHRLLHLPIAAAGNDVAGADDRGGNAGGLVEGQRHSHAIEPLPAVGRIGQAAADAAVGRSRSPCW